MEEVMVSLSGRGSAQAAEGPQEELDSGKLIHSSP